MFFNDLEDK